MISIVTYGRNDNYGFNLAKRTAMGLNCMAEVLSEEDEILFTDYNTPDHLPTLPESVWDTLTEKALNLIKVIRISRDLHEQIKEDSPLPILENVSRNAAIVRSNPKNHWILATNPDVLLVLASKWRAFPDLLKTLPDSFYEMPRFDIPESVWSSLRRNDPPSNMRFLRDWLITNGAAVVETVPEWAFQKCLLFDAPGDFQLAPRSYFWRLRGFDESMNKYLHSDSNLAKRMWLLNGGRTDHLLEHLWVLHQDHYLTGEWANNFATIRANDFQEKVTLQKEIEANENSWGLAGIHLPTFSLADKVKREQMVFQASPNPVNGDLPLSEEIEWRVQPFYRLLHYSPHILSLYLRENLRVAKSESFVGYVGSSPRTLDSIRRTWIELFPSGTPVCDLTTIAGKGESLSPDILLVDCYYERTENPERRIRLEDDFLLRKLDRGRITDVEADRQRNRVANESDMRHWEHETIPLWQRLAPDVRLRSGAYVVLMGSHSSFPTCAEFKEIFAPCLMGNLQILYTHHRLVVMRVK